MFSNQYRDVIKSLNKSNAVIEFKPDGTIITANENFLGAMGYSLDEVKGKHHSIFVDPSEVKTDHYKQFWTTLAKGEFQAKEYKRFGKGGKEIWINASYNPVKNAAGKVYKVVKYATDVTAQKLQNANYEGQLNAIGKSQAVIEFELDGTIITANENFAARSGIALVK
jgi:methyl-accepting chemotaxis protein